MNTGVMATWENDRRHQATCDWNLYGDQRPDPDLCNIDCLNRPDEVAAAWARLDGLGVADGHGHAGDKDDEEQPEFGHAPGIDKGGPSPAGALDPFGRDLAG